MRFLIYGAGAIGGALGVSLARSGSDVVLIARGAQLEAVQQRGLTLELPGGATTSRLAAVGHPSQIDFQPGDVVLLSVKSQDTEEALAGLAETAPIDLPVVCMQNGVENERIALRRFQNVYGAMVISPATFLHPGTVVVSAAPGFGLAEVGRYPTGSDETSIELAERLSAAKWESRSLPDVMRWKYAKLLDNLSNATQVVLGLDSRGGSAARRARAEGVDVLAAAGIDCINDDEMASRRAEGVHNQPVAGQERVGASTWQSLARGTRSVETDYLNGEIVLIARKTGQQAPVNALLQRLATRIAESGSGQQISEEEFAALLLS